MNSEQIRIRLLSKTHPNSEQQELELNGLLYARIMDAIGTLLTLNSVDRFLLMSLCQAARSQLIFLQGDSKEPCFENDLKSLTRMVDKLNEEAHDNGN